MGEIGGPGVFESFFTPEDGHQFPFIIPINTGTFEICIEQVVTQCDVTDDRACVTLNVEGCTLNDNDGDGVSADMDLSLIHI